MKFRKLLLTLPIIFVMIFTLLLLTYVGFGEAKRTFPRFQLKKMATQGEIITNAFDAYLQSGLPLNQFSGFSSRSEGVISSDDSVEQIRVIDNNNNTIFLDTAQSLTKSELSNLLTERTYTSCLADTKSGNYQFVESDVSYKITLPLNSKFGVAGYVILESDKEVVFEILHNKYRFVFYTFGILLSCFILFIVGYELAVQNKGKRQRILKIGFCFVFFAMLLFIGVTIFDIYESGAKSNTKVLSDSMAQRLAAVIELGIDIQDIDGINKAFDNYKSNNPDINAIAFIENDVSLFHTNKNVVGQQYKTMKNSYEYIVPLDIGSANKQELRVAVSIPVDIVMQAIRSNAKNFIVLFIACGLISLIFLDASTGLLTFGDKKKIQKERTSNAVSISDENFKIGLTLIKPAYFLIVFLYALSGSFLPQVVVKLAEATGSSIASTSLPFTIYYLFFAAVLIPAGHYAEKGSLKKLMGLGFIAEVFGLGLLAFTTDYWFLTVGRALSGIGQGFFLIGLQSYLLEITPEDKRTQGAAVKVIGRNAGLIAGTAIGALLYAYMEYNKVFIIASALSVIGMIYLWKLVPAVEFITGIKRDSKKSKKPSGGMLKNILLVFKDAEFMKTLLLVGLVGKMGITGVVMFAVPLVMARQNIITEDIGLALMLYYISSMLMTHFASKLVDKLGTTKMVLFASSLLGGIGVLLLGFIGVTQVDVSTLLPSVAYLQSFALNLNQAILSIGVNHLFLYITLVCLLLAGMSNGLLAAPVLTHINKTDSANKFGNKSITATYVFLERIGHVLGPMIISSLFIFTNQSNIAISLFGLITIVLGILFVVFSRKS